MRANLAKLAGVGAVAGLLCMGASPALAAAPAVTTYTVNQHGAFVEYTWSPCTTDEIAITLTGNSVLHVTQGSSGADGGSRITFTVEGVGSFVDEGVTYSGRYRESGDQMDNLQNASYGYRVSFDMLGSNGTVVTESAIVQLTLSAGDVPRVELVHGAVTCG